MSRSRELSETSVYSEDESFALEFERDLLSPAVAHEFQLPPVEPPVNVDVYWKRPDRVKWTIALFCGCFLAYSARTSLNIVSVAMGSEFGWDKRISGLVLSSFFSGYVLTQFIGGILADRFGGDKMLFISSVTWATATLFLPLLDQVPLLQWMPHTGGIIASRALAGFAQGVHFPALACLITKRVSPESRSSTFSTAASGTVLGTVFSGLAGTFLMKHSGWRSLFLVVGVLSVAWALAVKYLIYHESGKNESRLGVLGISKQESLPWLPMLRRKAFWALMFCAGCESWVFINLLSWLPTYFHDEFPGSEGWLFNVVPWVCSFIAQNASGMMADRLIASGTSTTYVRKLFVGIAMLSSAALCMLLNYAATFGQALLIMSIIIAALGCNSSGIGMNPQDLAPRHTGSMFGIMNTVAAVTGMLGVYVTGHILHGSGRWSSVFQLTSFLSLGGSVAFILFGSGSSIV